MDTGPHRLLAAATVIAAAHTWTLPPAQVGVMVVAAAVTGGGVLSPDMDLRWARVDGIVPDEVLGGGGPLGHRQVTHWVGWPALLAAWLTYGPPLPSVPSWILWGVVAGWGSHLVGDAMFGAAGYGHGKGVPLVFWWVRFGTGIPCGSLPARVVSYGVLPVALAWLTLTLVAGWPVVPSSAFLEALR